MPQIRDYTMNYTTVSAVTLSAYSPWDQAGDLLLAVLNATTVGTTARAAHNWSNTACFITSAEISSANLIVWSFNGSSPITPGLTIQVWPAGTGVSAQTIITGQLWSNDLPAANCTIVSGGTVGTATFTANSVTGSGTGIAVSQFVIGTGVPPTTYVSSIVGNVVTLTQNFVSNATGTLSFYSPGQTGTYTVNNPQTVANSTFTGNWSTLYSQSNGTLNSAVLWKISSGNEPDLVFSYNSPTTATQMQGHIIAVQDVNPAAPFNGTALTPAVPVGPSPAIIANTGVITSNASAIFTANCTTNFLWVSSVLHGALAPGMRLGNPGVGAGVGFTVANLRIVNQINGQTISASGTFSASSTNTITLTSVTGTIAAGNLVGQTTGIAAGTYVTSWFAGNSTAILSQNLTGTPSGTIRFFVPGFTGNYTVNQSQTVTSGSRSAGFDRSTMPRLTTTVNNSMIMYVNVDSTANIAMISEGPCIYEQGADGTAQSQGWSWGILPTAGQTPANVYWHKLGSPNTANAIVTTISISPPSGGATVIPAYCASDASYMIDPISGSSSYNLNIPPANLTGTQYFGASLNGAAYITANATISTGGNVDVGINSYHSMALMTGSATNRRWAGAAWQQNIFNRTDVTGKNILLHLKSLTPRALQNTDGIGRTGVKGLAFGMASSATNATAYKVWHVHGQGTIWNAATYVPIVINSDATKGLISSNGTLNPANIAWYGLFLSGTTSTPQWNFGSHWALDTTVIAGGNSLYPVGLNGVLKAAADGKERLSIITQGAGQAVVLQPIQFGDGGINPLYLNLDSTVIEFPKQYDIPSNQVYYCSADNVVGITYYAGTNDTIIHTNAVISSQSPFYWRINPLSSGTYQFDGTSVVGAGNILLGPTINFNGMVFGNCVEVLIGGGSITNTTFTRTAAGVGQGAIKIAASGQISLQQGLDKLANCSILYNSLASGGLHLSLTAGGGSAVTLSTSSLSFFGNNFDIYWNAPVNTPLILQQTGTQANIAKTWAAANNNTVILPPIRSLIIAGLIAGSNVSVYNANTFASPTVPIAGVNIIPNILAVGTGGLQSPYLYNLSITNVLSGTIAVGQTVTGSGILPGTTIIGGGPTVWTLSQDGILQPGGTFTFTDGPSTNQNNLIISTDTVNAGKYQAVYAYTYTTAIGSATGTTLTVSSLLSGNITIGQTVSGTGISSGTIITAMAQSTGGTGTYTLSQSATVSAGTYLTFDTPVNVVILNNGYQALRPSTSLTYNGTTVTVVQQLDRQFSNPS